MKTILFSGVHGVGKGFFLDKLKKDLQNYSIYSASNLIAKYQQAADAGYKKVRDVSRNQDILIGAIKDKQCSDTKDIIVDGHLCIFNANGEVERIPEYFFKDVPIAGIILLQDEPILISERIEQRDSEGINIVDLQKMQEEEQIYAQELEEKLGIRYVIVTHQYTGKQFENILKGMGMNNAE